MDTDSAGQFVGDFLIDIVVAVLLVAERECGILLDGGRIEPGQFFECAKVDEGIFTEPLDLGVVVDLEQIAVGQLSRPRRFECALTDEDDATGTDGVVALGSPPKLVADMEEHRNSVGCRYVCHSVSEKFSDACV